MDIASLAQAFGPVQEAMHKAAAERAAAVLEGRAGGGAVVVRISGDLRVLSVKCVPGVAQGEVAMLEDLIAAAFNDALRQQRERFGATPEEQLSRSMKSADMGGLMGMLGGLGGR